MVEVAVVAAVWEVLAVAVESCQRDYQSLVVVAAAGTGRRGCQSAEVRMLHPAVGTLDRIPSVVERNLSAADRIVLAVASQSAVADQSLSAVT